MELHRNIDNRVTCSGGSLLQPIYYGERTKSVPHFDLVLTELVCVTTGI